MNYTLNTIHPIHPIHSINNFEYMMNSPSIFDRNTESYFRGINNNVNNTFISNNYNINYDTFSFNNNNQFKNLFNEQQDLLRNIIRHSDNNTFRNIPHNTMTIPINYFNIRTQIIPHYQNQQNKISPKK